MVFKGAELNIARVTESSIPVVRQTEFEKEKRKNRQLRDEINKVLNEFENFKSQHETCVQRTPKPGPILIYEPEGTPGLPEYAAPLGGLGQIKIYKCSKNEIINPSKEVELVIKNPKNAGQLLRIKKGKTGVLDLRQDQRKNLDSIDIFFIHDIYGEKKFVTVLTLEKPDFKEVIITPYRIPESLREIIGNPIITGRFSYEFIDDVKLEVSSSLVLCKGWFNAEISRGAERLHTFSITVGKITQPEWDGFVNTYINIPSVYDGENFRIPINIILKDKCAEKNIWTRRTEIWIKRY